MIISCKNRAKIKYFCSQEQMPIFFTPEVIEKVNHLSNKLGENTQIWMYPDAHLKANGLPTGIACISPKEETILHPFILRDPGCGYLLFKLHFTEQPSQNWKRIVSELLNNFIDKKALFSMAQQANALDTDKIIIQGLNAVHIDAPDAKKFQDFVFPVNADQIKLTAEERERLQANFLEITNTIEIRNLYQITKPEVLSAHQIENTDFIGFIHSGSQIFPNILAKRFVYNIAEYATDNNLFSLEEIEQGIFGVPLMTTLGTEYANWLHAAMNYALVNRYQSYQAIKQLLEGVLPCKLTILSDNIHAGLLNNIENHTVSVRGVQTTNNQLNLIAGQRESIAALISKDIVAESYHNLTCHGTSYQVHEDYDYAVHFDFAAMTEYYKMAQETFCNSERNLPDCLPYTYNLLEQLSYFQNIKLIKPVALLGPAINLQSSMIKKDALHDRSKREFT